MPPGEHTCDPPGRGRVASWWTSTRRWWRDGRSNALVSFGALSLAWALRYAVLDVDPHEGPAGLSSLASFWVQFYGWFWGFGGATLLYLAVRRRRNRWLFSWASAPPMVWGIGYLFTAAQLDGDLAHQVQFGAVLFIALSQAMFWTAWKQPRGGWRA